jgi:hypothetical protein
MRFFLLLALVAGPTAFSASIYKKALSTKKDQYLTSGVVIGGQAGAGFTLLNVRRESSNKLAMERIIFDIGDRDGQPLLNRLGYYHISVEKNPSRIIVDLSQVAKSKVSEMDLARLFSKSPFVQKVEMSMEPEDNSAKIVLLTKEPVAAEIFEMQSAKKASRIVIDLKKVKL